MRRLTSQAVGKGLVVKGGQVQAREDLEDTLNAGLAGLIAGWRGLTPERAGRMIAGLNVETLRQALQADGLTEIPCNDANRVYLMRKIHGLQNHLQAVATAAENYLADKLGQEIKN